MNGKGFFKRCIALVLTVTMLSSTMISSASIAPSEWDLGAGWTATATGLESAGSGDTASWHKVASLIGGFSVSVDFAFSGTQQVETFRVSLGTHYRGDKLLATVQYSNSQLYLQLQSWDGTNWTTYTTYGWSVITGLQGTITLSRLAGSNTLAMIVTDTGSFRYVYETPEIASVLSSVRTVGLITLGGSHLHFPDVRIAGGQIGDWSGLTKEWSSSNETDGHLLISANTTSYSTIWYKSQWIPEIWQLSTEVVFAPTQNGTARILLGDANNAILSILTLIYDSTGRLYAQWEVWDNGSWLTLHTMDWASIVNGTVTVSLRRDAGTTVRLQMNDTGSYSVDRTITHAVVSTLKTVGLVSASSRVDFRHFQLSSLQTSGAYTTYANQAYNDLITNFWNTSGYLYATNNGTKQTSSTAKGVPWERSTAVFAMDAYRKATGSTDVTTKLEADLNKFFALYKNTLNNSSTAACNVGDGTYNVASDDAGWAAMMYMAYYTVGSSSTNATTRTRAGYLRSWAKTIFDNAYNRWKFEQNGQFRGLVYGDGTRGTYTSLYAAALAIAGLDIYASDSTQTAYRDKAIQIYNALVSDHGRSDGLYWCDVQTDSSRTPLGYDRPSDIGEAGSVSFLGGNMAMAVLGARLYRMTGEDTHRVRALRTADAIAAMETRRGVYLNDRDGWTDGQFASLYAAEVLSLAGIGVRHKQVMLETAVRISAQSRTGTGLYGAEWDGGTIWASKGTTSDQIMTTSNSIHMIIAARTLMG